MTYAGIDIGLAGAIAFLGDAPGSVPFGCSQMPLTSVGKRNEVDAISLECVLAQFGERPTVVVEECPHHTRSKAAMRSMALSFGKIIGALEVKGYRTIIVPAPRWQAAMFGKLPKGTTKAAARGLARRLWPGETFVFPGARTVHEGLIDACLIAEWARRGNL